MSRNGRHLFTSESVTEGHPDKIADQISDSILDAILTQDPLSRVACETLVTTGLVVVAGEITTNASIDVQDVVRQTITEVGYTRGKFGFDAETCAVLSSIHKQSPDIAQGVDTGGAGDQGLMFGFACTETEELMPLPIMLAHKLVKGLSCMRRDGVLDYLRPDGKSQVTIEYEGTRPVRVDTVVVSSQHSPLVTNDTMREDIIEKIINRVIPAEMRDTNTKIYVNPTGRFVVGGPHGDAGVTGRKIIVDTYGGAAPHGGGAFSGKDPTKVDRSACYMARYIAKNVVAAGIAERALVQLAYAIGVADPVSVAVHTEGTGRIPEEKITQIVRDHFKLTPRGIMEELDLRRPIYKKTAAFGHFGRNEPEFTWERTDKAAARAGLKFIVFTDHGDATRRPDPPAYRSGVLCLDGVEISTTGGHYIALDMPPAPYPLGGEPRDVVEDVHRLGGFGVVAHPDSPKLELRWREWAAPFDAIEILNPDSSWRAWAQQSGWRPKLKLFEALVDYPFRPAETIAGLLHEALDLPMRMAALTQRRRLVSLAGADAHAKLALPNADPGDSRFALPLPGYESAFRVLSTHVRLERALSGNAADDGGVVLRAIRAGHLYIAIDGLATPPSLELTASNASGTAAGGDELAAGSPVTLRVRTNAPRPFTTSIWDGVKLVSGEHHEQEFSVTLADTPAVYWVGIRSTGRTPELTWARSNPIYVRGPAPVTRPFTRPPVRTNQPMFDGTSAAEWRVEQDSTSVAAVELAPVV